MVNPFVMVIVMIRMHLEIHWMSMVMVFTCDDDCDDTTAFTYPNAAYLDMLIGVHQIWIVDMLLLTKVLTVMTTMKMHLWICIFRILELCYSDQDGDGYAPLKKEGKTATILNYLSII